MLPTLAFLSDQAPETRVLLMYAVLPVMVSVAIYFPLSRRDKADLGYRLRLLALVPVALGVILGALLSYRMATDFAYQQYNLIGQGRALMHYVVLGLNLAGAIGIFVWNLAASKGPKYDF